MQKEKRKTEVQKYQLKVAPQGDISKEEAKAYLEGRILAEVKKLAQGFTVSVYQIGELGKELVIIEAEIAKAELKKEDF